MALLARAKIMTSAILQIAIVKSRTVAASVLTPVQETRSQPISSPYGLRVSAATLKQN